MIGKTYLQRPKILNSGYWDSINLYRHSNRNLDKIFENKVDKIELMDLLIKLKIHKMVVTAVIIKL